MQNFNLEQDAVSWVFRPLIVCVHCVCAFACLHVCCITLFFFYMDYIGASLVTLGAYGHTTLNAPVLVRSPKLSSVGPAQYLDG